MAEHNHIFNDIGVSVTRYYSNDADEALTLGRIRSEINEVREHLPGLEPWSGLHIVIASENAPRV